MTGLAARRSALDSMTGLGTRPSALERMTGLGTRRSALDSMTGLGARRSALVPRHVVLAMVACAAAPTPVLACSVCFAANAVGASSSNAAIYVLLGATAIVLGGIGAFMRRLARLERAGVEAGSPKPEACEVAR